MQPTTPPTYLCLLFMFLVPGINQVQAQQPEHEAGPVVQHRVHFGAIALSDERILLVGGQNADRNAQKSAEVFDIGTQQFTPAGATQYSYYHPILLTLNDGRILAAGYHFAPKAGAERPDGYTPEIYDPNKNAWSHLDEIQFDYNEAVYANMLYDGRVLFLAVNGELISSSTRKDMQMFRAWLYDSDREAVETLTPPFSPRSGFYPAILPSGDVLATGGYGATFQPEHLCEQVPPEYAIEAGEPSGDWCASHGTWMGIAAPTTEVWDIFWDELTVYDQLPFEGATGLFTQILDNGDVLAVTRVDTRRRTQEPRSAATWSMESEQWTSLEDFPEYYHLYVNNDLLELDNGILIGPSGAYSLETGEWNQLPSPRGWDEVVQLPSGKIGLVKAAEAYWRELSTTPAQWASTTD